MGMGRFARAGMQAIAGKLLASTPAGPNTKADRDAKLIVRLNMAAVLGERVTVRFTDEADRTTAQLLADGEPLGNGLGVTAFPKKLSPKERADIEKMTRDAMAEVRDSTS